MRIRKSVGRPAATAACLVLAGAMLASCAEDKKASSSEGAATELIGVDYPRADSDFWNSYIKYTPQMADQLGVKIQPTQSANDVTKLVANVQTLLSQNAKAIVMAPQDTAAIAPSLDQLQQKKVPVVTIDTRPDAGNVFMVVRADNRAYGQKACQFLGAKLNGRGKVVMLQGDLASINGRDRTEAFNDCMKKDFPGIKVFGEATNWDAATASQKLQTDLTANPDIKGVYMQSSFALPGTLQLLRQRGLLVSPDDPKHVFVVSNDGIPEELKNIGEGNIDATVSQPADLYAKWALRYIKDAIDGKKYSPGKTDHDSTIVRVRPGVLEDQLSAPLVTLDGATFGAVPSVKFDDKSLWGNNTDGS